MHAAGAGRDSDYQGNLGVWLSPYPISLAGARKERELSDGAGVKCQGHGPYKADLSPPTGRAGWLPTSVLFSALQKQESSC